MNLTDKQIELITQNPYLHLKHYHELGNDDVGKWVNEMKKVKGQAQKSLLNIIDNQERKELNLLSKLFRGSCTPQSLIDIGFSDTDANNFCKAFYLGKNGGSVEEKVKGLNDLIGLQLSNHSISNTQDAITKAVNLVAQAFDNNVSHPTFSNLEEERMFISELNSIAKAIIIESKQKRNEGFIADALKAAVRKINSATQYYISDYEKKIRKNKDNISNLEKIFSDINEFINVEGVKNWKKEYQKYDNFADIQTVIEHSATGFLVQAGGASYEKYAMEQIKNTGLNILTNTIEGSVKGRGYITGGKLEKTNNKQQKGDIKLTFTSQTPEGEKDYFRISFSVKKKDSGTTIQIHHGGSIFSYANRFQTLGNSVGADFSFLDEGNFQYVYVNELMENGGGDLLSGFTDMLKGAGFIFLGEEIGKQSGADFLFIQGKIYAFSTILKRILNNENLLNVRVSINKNKQPISDKANLVHEPLKHGEEYYNEDFINKSIQIGRKAMYGVQFSINMLKSAYNP